jgi:hypothetical protein
VSHRSGRATAAAAAAAHARRIASAAKLAVTPQRNANQRNATQRNATQRNATQRNATHTTGRRSNRIQTCAAKLARPFKTAPGPSHTMASATDRPSHHATLPSTVRSVAASTHLLPPFLHFLAHDGRAVAQLFLDAVLGREQGGGCALAGFSHRLPALPSASLEVCSRLIWRSIVHCMIEDSSTDTHSTQQQASQQEEQQQQ